MTYNFDPDRWYENHRAVIQARLDREEIDAAAAQKLIDDLDRRFESLVSRLDGTFVLPNKGSKETN